MANSKKRRLLILFMTFLIFFFFSNFLLAQTGDEYIEELTEGTVILKEGDLEIIIYNIIQYILSFLGVAAILVIIYGGYLWMTAGGSEEKINKAKKIVTQAVIGLVVIILAYAISLFVIYLIRGELPK